MNFEERRKQLLAELQVAQSNLSVARSQVKEFETQVTRYEGAVIEMNFQIAEEAREKEEANNAAKAALESVGKPELHLVKDTPPKAGEELKV